VAAKLYCYADETGIDTQGKLFIVGIVVTTQNPDLLRATLESIEEASGKKHFKWIETETKRQVAYLKMILSHSLFEDSLAYALYVDARAYVALTRRAIASAVLDIAGEDHQATVYVDGLRKTQVHDFSVGLRRLGVRVRKVRGVRREESDALMRLADAICGFARAAAEGKPGFAVLLKQGVEQGYVRRVKG
jgi:hypothetical protein